MTQTTDSTHSIKVLVLADLHLDFWLGRQRDPFEALEPALLAALDALILAGDLSNRPKDRWPQVFGYLTRYVPPDRIYAFPGNHDFYEHSLDDEARLAKICADHGVNYAQKAVLTFGTARLLCCTLWTDFKLHGDVERSMQDAADGMNDYHYIRRIGLAYDRIRPMDTALVHADHVRWLNDQLAKPWPGSTIIITHHAPHRAMLGDMPWHLEPAYATDLTEMIETHRPTLWLSGHTHARAEVSLGETTIRNVSLGYPHQLAVGDEGAVLLSGLLHL